MSPSIRISIGPTETTFFGFGPSGITVGPVPQYLPLPDGWRQSRVNWKRSSETRALIRSNTSPYNYVKEIAKIIRNVYYNGSVESKIYISVERLNRSSSIDLPYEMFFQGELDLFTFSDGVIYNGESQGVSCAAIEGGITAQLDAAGGTKYPIEIIPAEQDNILMDGLTLQGTYSFLALKQDNVSGAPIGGVGSNMYMFSAPFTIAEGEYPIVTTNSPRNFKGGTYGFSDFSNASGPSYTTSDPVQFAYDNFLFKAGQAMTAQVSLNIPNVVYSGAGPQPVTLNYEIIVVPDNAAPHAFSQRYIIYTDPGGGVPAGATRNIPNVTALSNAFPMNTGDRLYIVATFRSPNGVADKFSWDEGNVQTSVRFRLPATLAPSLPLRKVVEKLLFAITGKSNVLQSDYLTNPNARYKYLNPYNVKITCGDALRNLTTNAAGDLNVNPIIKISWDELVRYLKYVHGCGIDVRDGKVIVEPTKTLFDSSVIIADVGEVKTFVVSPDRERFATAGKWGYPKSDTEKLNGRDAANTTSVWKYPFTKGAEEDCTVSVYTDPYVIEQTRANLANKKTTDADTDNNIFAIETESTPVTNTIKLPLGGRYITLISYKLYRPQVGILQPAITGFIDYASMYNLTFLPRLNIERNGAELRGLFYHLETQSLKFQTTENNVAININLGGGVFAANGDIPIASLDAPFASPNMLNVEAVLPSTFLSMMRSSPTGCIRFIENDILYKGFPMDVSIEGPDRDSYQMVLLCTADTDLTPKAI